METVPVRPENPVSNLFQKHKGSIAVIGGILLIAVAGYLTYLWGYMNSMAANEPYREFYACIIYGLDEKNQVPLGTCNKTLFQKLNAHMNVPAVPTPQQ